MQKSNHSSFLISFVQSAKWHTNPPHGGFSAIVLLIKQFFQMTFVDPRYEDEAIAALMEEALTEDSEETKFDVEKYIENSNFDW